MYYYFICKIYNIHCKCCLYVWEESVLCTFQTYFFQSLLVPPFTPILLIKNKVWKYTSFHFIKMYRVLGITKEAEGPVLSVFPSYVDNNLSPPVLHLPTVFLCIIKPFLFSICDQSITYISRMTLKQFWKSGAIARYYIASSILTGHIDISFERIIPR